MGQDSFFAMLSRMKYITRWGLMRNTREENLCEHTLETAILAHALAILRNRRFGGSVEPERAAMLALYHDASEIITGDLPTPVKYYNNELKESYKKVEQLASDQLLSLLPEDLRPDYQALLHPTQEDAELWTLCKAADKLSALIKCVQERATGNQEFLQAEQATLEAIHAMNLPEAECFLEEFLPAYARSLDEQARPAKP